MEGGDGSRGRGSVRRNPRVLLVATPDAGPDASEDVPELDARRTLVPAATAAAVALAAFVKRHAFTTTADAEPKLEGARAVDEDLRLDASRRLPAHRSGTDRLIAGFYGPPAGLS